MPKNIITAEVHDTIVKMRAANMTECHIAELLGLDHNTVHYDLTRRKTPYRSTVTESAIRILEQALARLKVERAV